MYYDADYVGKTKIALYCLRFTDIITILESNTYIDHNLVFVTFLRYHAKVQL